MYKKCRCTCQLCDACLDDYPACPCWKMNGFCTNSIYQNQRQLCRKSCGLCQTNSSVRFKIDKTDFSATQNCVLPTPTF